MRPDYPSKIFKDQRTNYVMLLQALVQNADISI
jgi:hypothetical protein